MRAWLAAERQFTASRQDLRPAINFQTPPFAISLSPNDHDGTFGQFVSDYGDCHYSENRQQAKSDEHPSVCSLDTSDDQRYQLVHQPILEHSSSPADMIRDPDLLRNLFASA